VESSNEDIENINYVTFVFEHLDWPDLPEGVVPPDFYIIWEKRINTDV
jgi:hypothetical protein